MIDAVGPAYSVTLNSVITIDALSLTSSNATLDHTLGTLRVLGTAQLNAGTLRLNGGVVSGGTWNANGATLAITSNTSNRLDGVTWNGDIPLSASSARLKISNGLTLNGTLSLQGSGSTLTFESNPTFHSGLIRFDPTTASTKSATVAGGATLNIGPAAQFNGGKGSILGSGGLVNGGLISADTAGQSLTVSPASITNSGIMEAINGATLGVGATTSTWTNAPGGLLQANGSILLLNGNWSNTGLIQTTNSTVYLGGSFSTTGMGTLSLTGGTVNVTGALNNSGANFTVPSGATWRLNGTTITGGTLTIAPSSDLKILTVNTLDNVHVVGPLNVNWSNGAVIIRNGTTFDEPITLSAPTASVQFEGIQTFDNNEILITSNFANDVKVNSGSVLTLGPNALIQGYGCAIGGVGGTVINHGQISGTPGTGTSLAIRDAWFTNHGAVDVNGGTLSIGGSANSAIWTNAPTGIITATNGTLALGGISWVNQGLIQATDSQVRLGGAFTTPGMGNILRTNSPLTFSGAQIDNAGSTINVDSASGSINLGGTTITGGAINQSQGHRLTFNSTGSNFARFYGVSINGGLQILNPTSSLSVFLGAGTTVNGPIDVSGGDSLVLTDDQEFSHPDIRLGLTTQSAANLSTEAGSDVTLGPATMVTTMLGHMAGTIRNRGTILSNTPGGGLDIAGDGFINEGLVSAIGSNFLAVGAYNNGANQGTNWTNALGGTIDAKNTELFIGSQWTNHGTVAATNCNALLRGTLTNYGTIVADAGATVLVDATSSNNQGLFLAKNGGLIRVVSPTNLSNLASGVLTNGEWNINPNSTLDFAGASITRLAGAEVTLTGPTSVFSAINGLRQNDGALSLLENRDFTTATFLNSTGILHLGFGSRLTVNGAYQQSESALFHIDISGYLAPNQVGNLAATGMASIAGGLRVDFLNGFVPALGSEFAILSAFSLQGQFSSSQLPALPGGLSLDVDYEPARVVLRVVSAPSPQPCDIDGDGDVDVDDQTLFIAVLLGGDTNPIHVQRSDISGDGSANGADVTGFVACRVEP